MAKIESIGYHLVNLSRWLVLIIAAILPWFLGGVLEGILGQFIFWSHLCGILWLAGWILRRQPPRVPWPLIVLVLATLLLGWFYVLNARFVYDPGFYAFTPLRQLFPGRPGTQSLYASIPSMWRIESLAIVLFIMTDAFYRSTWRQRSLHVLLFSGGLLAAFGLFQLFFRAPSVYWLRWDTGNTFFASFRYHANAGAFLNLCWPLALVTILTKPAGANSDTFKKAACIFFVLISVSLLANVSRAALGIGALAMFLFGLFILLSPYRHRLLSLGQWIKSLLLFVVIALALISFAGMLLPSGDRWERWSNQEFAFDESRAIVFRICGNIIREQPWFGFGPGTFATIFPFKSGDLGSLVPGFWRYAHSDYLQTLVEWGIVGTVLFLGICAGAYLRVFSKSFLRGQSSGADNLLLCYGCCASLFTVFLHASVDFPLQILSIQDWTVFLLALCWSRNGQAAPSSDQRP